MNDEEFRCSQCVKLRLSIQICSREQLIQHKLFEKCVLLLTCYHNRLMISQKMNQIYEILFTTVRSNESSSRTTVDLR